jgi:NtrC-family two-component system sensor histidine kinase KinB
MRLRSRLLLSHGVVIVLAIVAFAAALYAIRDLSGRVDAIAADKMEALESTERMRGEFSNVIRAVLQRSLSDDASQAPQSLAAATVALDGLHAAIENSRNYFLAPNEQLVFNEVAADYQRFAAAVTAWQEGKLSAPESANRISNIFRELRTGVARLRELKSNELGEATTAAREFANSMFALLGALALLLLCVGIFAMLRLVRVVCFQVDDLSDAVTKMGKGEYDITCKQAAVQEFNMLGRHLENMGRQLNVLRDSNVERVMAEQRRTNAVLDSIDDGLVIFSDEGTIERINAVAERQLGVDSGAAVGHRFEDIGDPTTGRHIRQVLASGEYVDTGRPEIRIECDGEIRLLAYTLHRFVESQSDRIGVVMVMRDITVQHEFDKMRSEFVLRASHELRTPIASIRMGLGLLGEKLEFAEGSRERELYQTVQDELTRMVGLLTDLLDLSRLRIGQQTLERAPTSIEEMLTAARQRFDPAATNAKIALTLQPLPLLPHVPLSRSGFDRVLDNLIANALRHTASGGAVTLSADATPRHLLIHVADTGEGIALAQQALIFEPFVQIGSKRGGAGLGLAICKEIVLQHGGEIRVDSQPRRGSTFTVALPI